MPHPNLSFEIVFDLLKKIALIDHYQDKWINANVILNLLKRHYALHDMTTEILNNGFSLSGSPYFGTIDHTKRTNKYGIYRHQN